MRNPHFDDKRLVWDDAYSGQYSPPEYKEQFDLQWKIALEGNQDYYNNPGTSIEDKYIDDRVYEWTGVHPSGRNGFTDPSMGSRVLDKPLDPNLIKGKNCVDIGCGMGRWTRTMQRIGAASVTSIDISESAIKSVSRFNDKVVRANIMNLPQEHPELVGKFDFGNFWGVAMCTHDPRKAFMSGASLIKPGGSLYLMVYHPESEHGSAHGNAMRKKFHRLKTVEERLALVDSVTDRRWDNDLPLYHNVKNVARGVLGRPKGSKIGWLDLLEPFYNWVVPADVVRGWYHDAGFTKVEFLNENERRKSAHHVLGTK